MVRWVDSFETRGGRERWLVFIDEGQALSSVMYQPIAAADDEGGGGEGFSLLGPSPWWLRMKTTPLGRVVLQVRWHLNALILYLAAQTRPSAPSVVSCL